MKRFLLVSLVLALCFSLVAAAYADTNINVDVDAGGDANVNIDVASDSGGGCVPEIPCDPGCKPKKPTCIIINGVPCCIEPEDPVDPEQAAREARNRGVKAEARAVWEYLESELERIGWSHGQYKIIRSFEVRVIYGSKGNNSTSERAPITFYCEADPSIKVKCYMITLLRGNRYPVLFATSFRTGKRADEYDDEWIINTYGQEGSAAVDEFIEYLESLTPGSGS